MNNNMTKEIINDGSKSGRAKMNRISAVIGGILMLSGFVCFIIKTLSAEYVDASGILHEKFFLIPAGFLLLICGAIIILSTGIRHLINKRSQQV